MNRTHHVLKTYIALARGESYDAPEYTEAMLKEDVETGNVRYAERVWYVNERWLKQVCQAADLTEDEVYEKGIIHKPSVIANLIYSNKLYRMFGDLSDVPGFEGNVFQLPSGYGVLYPVRIDGLITELKFYPMVKLLQRKRKAA